jgi:OOP family OmpA-OmpF porin
MSDPYQGVTKSVYEKNLATLMNRTIPNLRLTGGLRTFGDISYWTNEKTALLYGMTQYTETGLQGAIEKVRSAGNSPLELAIDGAARDLKNLPGESAVVIFSDGEDMTNAPVLAARNLKSLYGDRVCIYTVLVGNTTGGQNLLERVAQAGHCGFFVKGESLASSEGMADFVEKVFLTRKAVAEKPAPAAEKMKEALVPRESAPAAVQAPEKMTLNIQFDTGKAVVKPKYFSEIKKVADFMTQYPDARAVIEGHTDNVGKEAANIKLSQRRADAIKKILVEKYGIDGARLKAVGYGPNKPIASNKTAGGRQKNRRVDAIFER